MVLASGASRLEWPEHFSAPLDMTSVHGAVDWERAAAGWRLEAPDLRLEQADASLAGRFALDLPDSPREKPFLDARLNIADAAAPALRVFIPRDLPEATREWLEQAFPAGRIVSGALVWRGAPADYPFPGGEGVFGGALDVRDGVLRFQPDWPPLENLDATVRFDGDRIQVKAARATITGVGIRAAEADITHLSGETPSLLTVEGEVEAALPQMLDFFAQTPFRDIPAHFRKYASIDGGADLRLKLDVNLRKKTVDASGALTLKDARAALDGDSTAIDNISGVVSFDPQQLRAEGAQGVLMGQPVKLATRRDAGEIRIEAVGSMPLKTLEERFPAVAGRGLSGQLPYRLGLGIPWSRTANHAELRLESDLLGVGVDLPEPLGKKDAESRALSLEMSLREGEARLPLEVAYGDVLHSRFSLRQENGAWSAPAGAIALGTAAVGDMPDAGWSLRGRLDALPLDAWRDWWVKTAGNGRGAILREIDLEAARPSWEGRDLGAGRLVVRRGVDAWEGDIDWQQAAGQVYVPFAAGPDAQWRLNLRRVRLPKLEKETLERVRRESPDPATLPGFSLTSEHLFWNELDLGHLDVQVRRHPQGLAIERGEVRGDGVKADFQGQWLRNAGRDETQVDGKMAVDNLGALLTRAGKPKEVRDTPATLEWKLRWPDAPQRVTMGVLEGTARLDLGKGSLPQFEPGLARALGLLNLNSVMRRLTLDFSDVLEEGFAYDHIRGSFKVTGGQAETSDFTVEGVSARIVASGRVDLPGQAFQMVVTVAPHTSVVLPTIGSLAGGPLVGAAVLAAQTLVGDKLEVLTETQYALTGPWSAPEVKRISRFTPLGVFQQAWDGMKDLSGMNNANSAETESKAEEK
ncbi:MAG TPA: YhdP family protein [Methylococcaceae bacterium]|nr:YhdP family protein [Methylococcaceae bacterium]